jgi:GT2 family glycosyltransferase
MPVNKKQTPLAVFTYNRPSHAEKLFESLARCERLDECSVRIYCDGPKKIDQVPRIEESRAVARTWAKRLGAEVVERGRNRGLARSIVEGATELCEDHGRVIVVEDDFVLSPDFLDYMLQALDRYENEEAVFQVSGYMPPVRNPAEPDVLLLPLSTTWGWATWARAWKFFDWKAAGWTEQLPEETRRRFDLGGAYPYSRMLTDRLSQKNDSWGILWWWTVFNAGGLVSYPRQSLVWVGGWDGSGTHCGSFPAFPQSAVEAFSFRRLSAPIRFPAGMTINEAAFERVRAWLKRLAQPLPPGAKEALRNMVKSLFASRRR